MTQNNESAITQNNGSSTSIEQKIYVTISRGASADSFAVKTMDDAEELYRNLVMEEEKYLKEYGLNLSGGLSRPAISIERNDEIIKECYIY